MTLSHTLHTHTHIVFIYKNSACSQCVDELVPERSINTASSSGGCGDATRQKRASRSGRGHSVRPPPISRMSSTRPAPLSVCVRGAPSLFCVTGAGCVERHMLFPFSSRGQRETRYSAHGCRGRRTALEIRAVTHGLEHTSGSPGSLEEHIEHHPVA
jgi:hypothetical protein